MKDTLRHDVVQEIWGRSPGRYASVATINRLHDNDFREEYLSIAIVPSSQRYGYDLFFSALQFNEKKRSNTTVGLPGILFADLDASKPFQLNPVPTYAWETSPESYQAVWFLETPIPDYQTWADLNSRMTEHTHADPGGWAGSKLLRYPGSANFKRATDTSIPVGSVVMDTHSLYTLEGMDRVLPSLNRPSLKTTGEAPPLPTARESDVMVAALFPLLTLRGRYMLLEQSVTDRSWHIVKTIREMKQKIDDPKMVFDAIWWRPWNKWRIRNQPDRLWHEIMRTSD